MIGFSKNGFFIKQSSLFRKPQFFMNNRSGRGSGRGTSMFLCLPIYLDLNHLNIAYLREDLFLVCLCCYRREMTRERPLEALMA